MSNNSDLGETISIISEWINDINSITLDELIDVTDERSHQIIQKIYEQYQDNIDKDSKINTLDTENKKLKADTEEISKILQEEIDEKTKEIKDANEKISEQEIILKEYEEQLNNSKSHVSTDSQQTVQKLEELTQKNQIFQSTIEELTEKNAILQRINDELTQKNEIQLMFQNLKTKSSHFRLKMKIYFNKSKL